MISDSLILDLSWKVSLSWKVFYSFLSQYISTYDYIYGAVVCQKNAGTLHTVCIKMVVMPWRNQLHRELRGQALTEK